MMDKSWLVFIFLIVIFVIFALYKFFYKGKQDNMIQTTGLINPVLGMNTIKDQLNGNINESFNDYGGNDYDGITYDDPDDDDDDLDNDNTNSRIRIRNEIKNRIKRRVKNGNNHNRNKSRRNLGSRTKNIRQERNLDGGDDLNWKARINDNKPPGSGDYDRVGSKWISGESNDFPSTKVLSGYRVFKPNISFNTDDKIASPPMSLNSLPPNDEDNENFEDYDQGNDTNFLSAGLSNLGSSLRDFDISNLVLDDGSDQNAGNYKEGPEPKESTVTISRPVIENSGSPGDYKPGHDPREKYPWMYPNDQGEISYKSPDGCPCPVDSTNQGAVDLRDCLKYGADSEGDESCACFNTHGLIKKNGKMYRKRPGQDYDPENDPKRIAKKMMKKAKKSMNTFPTKIKSEAPIIQTSPALKDDNVIAISSIDGFEIGDQIKINENCDNEEKAVIANLGSNLLYLTDGLKKDHYPNEPVFNLSNQNIIYPPNKKCLRNSKNYYGYNKAPGKILPKIAFNPKSTGPSGKRKPLSNLQKRLGHISRQQRQFGNRNSNR